MSCPGGASLLAMSATVRNPGDLGAWIGAVHGKRGGGGGGARGGGEGGGRGDDESGGGGGGGGGGESSWTPATAETIVTSARPVPLTWMYAWSTPPWLREQQQQQQQRDEGERGGEREEEEEAGGERGERRKPSSSSSSVRLVDLLAPRPPGVVGPGGSGGGDAASSPSPSPSSSSSQRPARLRLSAALRPRYPGGGEEPKMQPAPVPLARELERRGLLPAIWFVFSRAGCDATATAIGRSRAGGGESGRGGGK